MKTVTLFLSVLILTITGCGVYTFNPKGKSSIKTISIERFSNNTSEYGLEDRMTDQIIDAFISDGTLKIATAENSEAVLNGALVSYVRKPYNPDENDQVNEYAVRMTFNISLVNQADGVEIWKDNITQLGVYNLESETEEDGQQKAIEFLIETIINKTTKSW